MNILYIYQLTPNIEIQKEQKPRGITVNGGAVYQAQAVEALLKYSTYDYLVFARKAFADVGDLRHTELFAKNSHRIRFVNERELASIPQTSPIVLASLAIEFEELVRLRSCVLRRQVPCTGITHSLYATYMLHGFLSLYLSPLSKRDALICSSSAAKKAVTNTFSYIHDRFKLMGVDLEIPSIELPIIPLGIDTDSYSAQARKSNHEIKVLYFGRLSVASKADLYPLLIVWNELRRDIKNARLILAGDDSHHLSESLQAFIKTLGCSESVQVVADPCRSVKRQLYETADIFVSPSDTLQESFGITLLEAMASGIPVVASDWSGYRDLIIDGKTGYLIPTFFPDVQSNGHEEEAAFPASVLARSTCVDLRGLKASLRQLLVDRETRLEFGKRGRDRAVQNFDWRIIVKRYEELWQYLSGIARCSTTPRDSMNLDEFNTVGLFGHYATDLLTTDTFVRAVEEPSLHQDKAVHIASGGDFDEQTIFQIMTLLPVQYKRLSDLHVDSGSLLGISLSKLIAYIGRMAKYGLVDVSSETPGQFGAMIRYAEANKS